MRGESSPTAHSVFIWKHRGRRIPFRAAIPGCAFPTGPQRENASHFQAEEWDAFSQPAPTGNCIPLSSRKPGCIFRLKLNWKIHPRMSPQNGTHFPVEAQRESASQNRGSSRDALSERGPLRKACPGIRIQNGTTFPPDAQRESRDLGRFSGPCLGAMPHGPFPRDTP